MASIFIVLGKTFLHIPLACWLFSSYEYTLFSLHIVLGIISWLPCILSHPVTCNKFCTWNTVWHLRSGCTLDKVLLCWLTASSCYRNLSWIFENMILLNISQLSCYDFNHAANNKIYIWKWLFNSLRLGDAYMRHWTGSSLVQIMACCLFGAKPLSEPMLRYH